MMTGSQLILRRVVPGALLLLLSPPLVAQAPFEMTRSDKAELFLQHLGKVVRVEPEVYQSLLLEYELARSLTELGTPHPDPLLGDYIQRAVEKLHPEFAGALRLREAGKVDEALGAFRELGRQKDPYLGAHARLHVAELESAKGRHEASVKLAGALVTRDRQYLFRDYRACELLAEAFRHLEKPLLEYLQYSILLIDYREVPAEVENRVKARLAALEKDAGRPMHRVAGWMDSVERWIRALQTSDDPTQKQQGEILVALDKMIELQEARERNTCPNCGKGG